MGSESLRDLLAVLALAGVLAISGCATEQPATQAQIQKLGETCQAYGFKPGSDAFVACIFQLDQERIASNRQRRMAAAAILGQTGAQMQANARHQQTMMAVNRPVNCISTPGLNGVVRTNCY